MKRKAVIILSVVWGIVFVLAILAVTLGRMSSTNQSLSTALILIVAFLTILTLVAIGGTVAAMAAMIWKMTGADTKDDAAATKKNPRKKVIPEQKKKNPPPVRQKPRRTAVVADEPPEELDEDLEEEEAEEEFTDDEPLELDYDYEDTYDGYDQDSEYEDPDSEQPEDDSEKELLKKKCNEQAAIIENYSFFICLGEALSYIEQNGYCSLSKTARNGQQMIYVNSKEFYNFMIQAMGNVKKEDVFNLIKDMGIIDPPKTGVDTPYEGTRVIRVYKAQYDAFTKGLAVSAKA